MPLGVIVCSDVPTTFASAANIFGPQKGADKRMVADLRERLLDLEGRYHTEYHVDQHAARRRRGRRPHQSGKPRH